MSKTQKPLAGLKVVELGTLIAGPFCTRVLAEFGALHSGALVAVEEVVDQPGVDGPRESLVDGPQGCCVVGGGADTRCVADGPPGLCPG